MLRSTASSTEFLPLRSAAGSVVGCRLCVGLQGSTGNRIGFHLQLFLDAKEFGHGVSHSCLSPRLPLQGRLPHGRPWRVRSLIIRGSEDARVWLGWLYMPSILAAFN